MNKQDWCFIGSEVRNIKGDIVKIYQISSDGGIRCSGGSYWCRTELEPLTNGLNGYRYAVEYPTNGKKPDLPDNLMIVYIVGSAHSRGRVFDFTWDSATAFRIVDKRYKPVEQKPEFEWNTQKVYKDHPEKPMQDLRDWWDYENNKPAYDGALPPVGTECLYFNPKTEVWCHGKVIARHDDSELLWFEGEGLVYAYHEHFKPLDHETRAKELERKKVVDAAAACFYGHCMADYSGQPFIDGLSALYDKGFLKLP